jgi:hypothetical protein
MSDLSMLHTPGAAAALRRRDERDESAIDAVGMSRFAEEARQVLQLQAEAGQNVIDELRAELELMSSTHTAEMNAVRAAAKVELEGVQRHWQARVAETEAELARVSEEKQAREAVRAEGVRMKLADAAERAEEQTRAAGAEAGAVKRAAMAKAKEWQQRVAQQTSDFGREREELQRQCERHERELHQAMSARSTAEERAKVAEEQLDSLRQQYSQAVANKEDEADAARRRLEAEVEGMMRSLMAQLEREKATVAHQSELIADRERLYAERREAEMMTAAARARGEGERMKMVLEAELASAQAERAKEKEALEQARADIAQAHSARRDAEVEVNAARLREAGLHNVARQLKLQIRSLLQVRDAATARRLDSAGLGDDSTVRQYGSTWRLGGS